MPCGCLVPNTVGTVTSSGQRGQSPCLPQAETLGTQGGGGLVAAGAVLGVLRGKQLPTAGKGGKAKPAPPANHLKAKKPVLQRTLNTVNAGGASQPNLQLQKELLFAIDWSKTAPGADVGKTRYRYEPTETSFLKSQKKQQVSNVGDSAVTFHSQLGQNSYVYCKGNYTENDIISTDQSRTL